MDTMTIRMVAVALLAGTATANAAALPLNVGPAELPSTGTLGGKHAQAYWCW